MRYYALATDYDGTLALAGRVDPKTVEAVQRFKASGRKLLLVTGRVFLQLAEGIDPDTWLYHLRQRHYSRWFRDMIKDEGLVEAAAGIERMPNLSAEESKARIREAVEERHTAPE